MKTYSKLLFTTILFLTYSISSFAFNDISELLDNSDITWAAEVYTDYAPNVNHFAIKRKELKAKYGISSNTFVTLKIHQDPKDAPIRMRAMTLANQVLMMESINQSNLFKDADLKEPLNYADYQKITQERTFDTTFITQPDGTSKIGHIFKRKIYFNDVPLFRVKQILTYNAKTNELNLIAVAIAPLFCEYNKNRELIGTSPLFWMSIEDFDQEIDLNSSSVNWAKRITRSIDTEEIKVVKGKETLAEILNAISNRYAQEPESSKLYHTYGEMLPMSSKDVKNLNSGIDTIITFDPNTFEEIVSEIAVSITPKTMREVRIIQDWVWNKETQSLNIKFIAFAPIVKRFDNKNNFLHSGPLFYKKPNDQ